MSDRFQPGRLYYVVAGHYGPYGHEHEHDTLVDAVADAQRLDGPGRHHIELRTVAEQDGALSDHPLIMFTADGHAPNDFAYVARHLREQIFQLERAHVFVDHQGAELDPDRIRRALGSARSTVKTLRALADVVQRGVDAAEAEAHRQDMQANPRPIRF